MVQTDVNPMDLAWRVATGQFSESVLGTLQRGFAAFIDAAGAVPLERCLRLPVSPARFRQAQRDQWLAEVVRSTEGKSPWARYVAASAALDAFLSRGQWRAWCDMQDPPPGTSNLRVALFYTARFGDGKSLCPVTVRRRVGHLFQ